MDKELKPFLWYFAAVLTLILIIQAIPTFQGNGITGNAIWGTTAAANDDTNKHGGKILDSGSYKEPPEDSEVEPNPNPDYKDANAVALKGMYVVLKKPSGDATEEEEEQIYSQGYSKGDTVVFTHLKINKALTEYMRKLLDDDDYTVYETTPKTRKVHTTEDDEDEDETAMMVPGIEETLGIEVLPGRTPGLLSEPIIYGEIDQGLPEPYPPVEPSPYERPENTIF